CKKIPDTSAAGSLEAVIARALRLDPAERFQSVAELHLATRHAASVPGRPRWLTRAYEVARPGRQRLLLILTVVVVFSGAALIMRFPSRSASEIVPLTADPGTEADPGMSPDGRRVVYAASDGLQS